MATGQRTNRTRQQRQTAARAARAVAAARGNRRDWTRITIAVVVVLVVAAAVVVGLLVTRHKTTEANRTVIPALTVAGSTRYPTTIDSANATVLVGKPTAKVTVDAYEDFLCPICQQFESTYFAGIQTQLQAGTVKVRYHMLNLLDSRSVPAGYSMLAANTALAVATVAPSKFIDFHYSLYHKQPEENGPGWTQDQLTNLAVRLGVSGAQFDHLIADKTYDQQIQANLNIAENDAALRQNSGGSSGFGTPTVLVDGKAVNWQTDTNWLTTAVQEAYPHS